MIKPSVSEFIRSAVSQGGARAQQRRCSSDLGGDTRSDSGPLHRDLAVNWQGAGEMFSHGLGAARVDGVGAGPVYRETEQVRRQLVQFLGGCHNI